ncbi:hypothetical protein V8E51_002755 [Hyaloscypha variabilis]
MSDWSTLSQGTAPVYTPTASGIGSLHNDQSMVDTPTSGEKQSSNLPPTNSTTTAPYDGPDTVLAIFRYEFTTLPRSYGSSNFTLKDHPLEWPVITGFEDNGAAKLLLVIFWATVLDPKKTDNFSPVGFWNLAGEYAHSVLFDFLDASEQYLGWVQNMKQRSKGSLHGVVSGDGQKFFLVTRYNLFVWLSDNEGLELAKHVIGELPTLKLELI